MRIENVVKVAARLERRAIATRNSEGHVLKLDGAAHAAGSQAVANAKPPRAPIRMLPERAEFAQINDGALETLIAQHVRDGVGDITLSDAVQRNCHAGACESDGGRAAVDLAEVHERTCNVAGTRRKVRLNGGLRPEMRL